MHYLNWKNKDLSLSTLNPHLIADTHYCKEMSEFPIAFEVLFDTLKKIFNAPRSMKKDLKLQTYLR